MSPFAPLLAAVLCWTPVSEPVDFTREVLPILKRRCFQCHGPRRQEAELRLDLRSGLFGGPDAEFAPVVPGSSARSDLIALITLDADDPDRMPKTGAPLEASEIETLRAWIDQGAPWVEPPRSQTDPVRSEAEVARSIAALREGSAHAAARPVDFGRDIRPLLAENCFFCHGPDPSTREAKLRLDLEEGLFAKRPAGGRVVVPGEPSRSLLIDRITQTDPDFRMPPQRSHKVVDEEQRRLLVDWIESGAQWQQHWSLVPARAVEPPEPASDWPINEIDRFVLARLQQEGLQPRAEADRRTLARRLSLDLIGLPPELEDVERFCADDQPGAVERLVDRLLASPRYGEHMARFWLDAARYGDTHGLHLDNYREMWPYRDWVIEAFNANLPFDQFAVEQLAGDLLPSATLGQRIASGFNRAHVSTNEGGSIEEEVYVRNVVDRVNTVGTVFMGLTVGCAACHDHKFDPLPQREYYQLFSFFNNLDGSPMDGNVKAPSPIVQVPTEEQSRRMETLRGELSMLEAEIARELSGLTYEEPNLPWPYDGDPLETHVWIDDRLPPGAMPQGDELLWCEAPRDRVHTGRFSMKRQGKGSRQHFFANADRKLRIGQDDLLFTWVYLDPADPPREILLQFNADGGEDWGHRAYFGENLIDFGQDDSVERRRLGDLPAAGRWVRLEVPAALVGLYPGSVVHGMAFTQFDGTVYYDTVGIESRTPQEPEDFAWIDDDVPSGGERQGDGSTWNWVGRDQVKVKSGLRCLKRKGGGGLNQDYFINAKPLELHAGDRLFAYVYLDPDDPPRSVQLQFNNGNWEHRVRLGEEAHGAGREGGADYRAGDLPPSGEWTRIEVDLASVGLKPGERLNGWAFTQVGGTVYWDLAGVRTWSPPDDRPLHSMLAWEERVRGDAMLPEPVRAALQLERSKRSPEQARLLQDHYLRFIFAGTRQVFDALESRVEDLTAKIQATDQEIATTLVMRERTEPRDAFVLKRGQYDEKGEKVERETPAALPPMDEELPRNRLGFARWLVDPGHPLTARVTVNRLWQQLFGTGLVKTAEDFGSQGEPPSHPELLDWLAARFVEEGWDVKRMLKRMALSAAYRQDAEVGEDLFRRDPENRLLARGPRLRLDAEVLRDQALSVSGLLVNELGGPSVKPPQPDGLWFAVGYTSSNTARFMADEGHEKIHRRTLYTFLKRTAPPPQLSTFDAPSRESCQVRRERTNTPLQALLLMNDPQYVEAARSLAERVLREGAGAPEGRVDRMYERVLFRRPDPATRADLSRLYREALEIYREQPEEAVALVRFGAVAADPALDGAEVAAWTLVASTILNLDEVVTKS